MLGDRDVRMAEDVLDGFDVHAAAKEVGSTGVPEIVEADVIKSALDDQFPPLFRQGVLVFGFGEDRADVLRLAQGFDHGRQQGHETFLIAFASDQGHVRVPGDVLSFEFERLGSAATGPKQENPDMFTLGVGFGFQQLFQHVRLDVPG